MQGGPVSGGPAGARPPAVLRIRPDDTVAVALRDLSAGEAIQGPDRVITVRDDVPAGHKVALRSQSAGEEVVKYGFGIGHLTAAVAPGTWVHTHNLATALEGLDEYTYEPVDPLPPAQGDPPTFQGYRRPNGTVGTRNDVWVVNTVGCVNTAADRIARTAADRLGGRIDGVHAFSHPYGCSQLGDDLVNTQKVLAGLIRHPNAGGVLVLGLGCENNQLERLLERAGAVDRSRIRSFNTQDVLDEVEEGVEAVAGLAAVMAGDRRETVPISELVVGLKCGGSDGFSGISANPLVGRVADRLTGHGAAAILTEVPEMFGAERVLMGRAVDEAVFRDVVALIDDFKQYFLRHDQPIYENPSPGNLDGGITTLEEKSLGAIQKGGGATVTGVLRYGDPVATPGLSLLEAPGNDGVSSTAMVASGATLLLFTTGRGTPLGFPVPTVKISSNSAIAEKKPHWIDFDAGGLLDGRTDPDRLTDQLFDHLLEVASGTRLANNEKHGYREIAIWKEGVTL